MHAGLHLDGTRMMKVISLSKNRQITFSKTLFQPQILFSSCLWIYWHTPFQNYLSRVVIFFLFTLSLLSIIQHLCQVLRIHINKCDFGGLIVYSPYSIILSNQVTNLMSRQKKCFLLMYTPTRLYLQFFFSCLSFSFRLFVCHFCFMNSFYAFYFMYSFVSVYLYFILCIAFPSIYIRL